MPFCGHASFAAAHIILNVLSNNLRTVQFITKGNGTVKLERCALNANSMEITMSVHAGNIAETSQTSVLLAKLKQTSPETVDFLCALGLVANNIADGKCDSTTSHAHVAKCTAELIDNLLYEAKTGNLIFILRNASAVLQAKPDCVRLV
uniref:Vesicle-associated membrane protein 5 n=1 Tax=Lygus hesperus TaxID=30085 RepID=A0A0A9YW76_LYGHE